MNFGPVSSSKKFRVIEKYEMRFSNRMQPMKWPLRRRRVASFRAGVCACEWTAPISRRSGQGTAGIGTVCCQYLQKSITQIVTFRLVSHKTIDPYGCSCDLAGTASA